MRWVSTVTWFWVGLVVFMHGATWLITHASCKGDALAGCLLLAVMALPVWVVTVLGVPFLLALWLARFVHWLSHRQDGGQRIGYVAPPPARPESTPAESSNAGHRWLG